MTAPRKYRIVVEAMQWDGTQGGSAPIAQWILSNGIGARYQENGHAITDNYETRVIAPALVINTHSDVKPIFAHASDWIVRGVRGEFYLCEPDIFESTYERVDPPTHWADA